MLSGMAGASVWCENMPLAREGAAFADDAALGWVPDALGMPLPAAGDAGAGTTGAAAGLGAEMGAAGTSKGGRSSSAT